MRYLCFVKMDESLADPPQAIMDAMGEHVGEAIANGSFVDGGGLYGAKEAVEYRVRGGTVTVTDGAIRRRRAQEERIADSDLTPSSLAAQYFEKGRAFLAILVIKASNITKLS